MLAEFPMHIEMLAARCAELPMLLSRVQEPSIMMAWSSESFGADDEP
jgi:hypothetical protein